VGLGCRVPKVDESFRYLKKVEETCCDETIMAVSLGVHVKGAVNFWPDTTNQDGAVLGVMKRIATDMPKTDPVLFEEFFEFSRDFIQLHMMDCVLPPDVDLSVDTWLEGTNYSGGRKAELQRVWEEFIRLRAKDFDVMFHVKYESYNEAKHFRGIYSRSDSYKCFFGPLCAAIGKRFFHLPWFVKYLSSREKMERMCDLFCDDLVRIFSNDFTSFEATFTALLMSIEVFFFEFCLQNVPNREEILDTIRKTKYGINRMVARKFYVWLRSKRYSGEMDTSLCNSLNNLLFVCFLLHKAGHSPEFYVSIKPPQIEGDDCIGALLYDLDETILFRLGAKAKLENFRSFNEASFCGMVFSEGSQSIIRDPISAILDFGYVNYQYVYCGRALKDKLLRAKGLSLLHSYPGCPVLKSLAMYALRVTMHVGDKNAVHALMKSNKCVYRRRQIVELFSMDKQWLLDVPIVMESRLLMADKFGVSVADQYAIEKYLDGLLRIQPLDCPAILDNCGPSRINHFSNFCCIASSVKGKPPKGKRGRHWLDVFGPGVNDKL